VQKRAPGEVREPRVDDGLLTNLSSNLWGYAAVLVAHQLGVFALLAEKPCSLDGVCERLKLNPRPAHGLLSAAVALGLARLENGTFALTPIAEDYLLKSSPTYWGPRLDLDLMIFADGVAAIKKAALTDSPQAHGGGDVFATLMQRPELVRDFTRGMHSISMAPALSWPAAIDLSAHRMMLDVGGGSGAHSIGAALRWPDLKATVFDFAPVCEVAREFAAAAGLADRVATQVGDMWNDPFPAADIHFYSSLYHDWPPAKCRFLTQKSFHSLKPGGKIIIHEILFNDERTGPLAAAAYNLMMLYWVPGQQYSGRELSAMLSEAGFADIKIVPTFSSWSIVTATKP
jgi:SAM-dependent methyltransferase